MAEGEGEEGRGGEEGRLTAQIGDVLLCSVYKMSVCRTDRQTRIATPEGGSLVAWWVYIRVRC